MFAKGLFTNILLVAVSIGIFITYLQPTFAVIETDQDSIAKYEEELTKVQSVNARLNQLASVADQLSIDDRDRLYTYLPNEIDSVAVQRDLFLMAESVGIDLVGLASAVGPEGQPEAPLPEDAEAAQLERSQLVPHHFEIEFVASYDVLKSFLATLEQNHYPLQVSALTISAGTEAEDDNGEGTTLSVGDLTVAMTVSTYSLTMQESAY